MAYAYRGTEGLEDNGVSRDQLNDCGPGTSWSIAEYCLWKKATFYAIARALLPVVVGVQREHHY
jgi:beta-mannosidase